MLKSEMKDANKETLESELKEVLREQFNLRIQHKTGQLNNSAQLRKVRRQVARLKTFLNKMS